ncbi:MAG: hypothetical protein DSY83_01400 [Flavobacteriia bacterium]|nr:MAG: hypothetical protein DSY83_01400 [Flavobacteriia bacterium]
MTSNTNAQETIARFKYEDAEKAFVSKNYQECIDNLNEAEKLLGKTAPNILHLKIMAQDQINNGISKKVTEKVDLGSLYDRMHSLKKDCEHYLSNYDIAGLEEKYRDVYNIYERIKELPESKTEFMEAHQRAEEKEQGEIVAMLMKAVKAQGGLAALERVKTVHMIGETSRLGKSTLYVDEKYMAPDMKCEILSYKKGGKQPIVKIIVKGKEAFFEEGNKGRSVLYDPLALSSSTMFRELDLVAGISKGELEFGATHAPDGAPGIIISTKVPNGFLKELRQYDASSGLLQKVALNFFKTGKVEPVRLMVFSYSDYREVDGIKIPFQINIGSKYEQTEKAETRRYSKVLINQGVVPSDFD